MKFTSEKILKNKYIATAKFYELVYPNGKIFKCRSVLNIYDRDHYHNDFRNKSSEADCVVVMMNPGGSKPLYLESPSKILASNINEVANLNFVDVIPDKTQYQIMRIMEHYDWKMVKVINLSDIRESISKEFIKKHKYIRSFDSETLHSIFSAKRKDELDKIFAEGTSGYSLLIAWGVTTGNHKLIQKAHESEYIKDNAIWGFEHPRNELRVDKKKVYFYHPLPQGGETVQKQWLREIQRLKV